MLSPLKLFVLILIVAAVAIGVGVYFSTTKPAPNSASPVPAPNPGAEPTEGGIKYTQDQTLPMGIGIGMGVFIIGILAILFFVYRKYHTVEAAVKALGDFKNNARNKIDEIKSSTKQKLIMKRSAVLKKAVDKIDDLAKYQISKYPRVVQFTLSKVSNVIKHVSGLSDKTEDEKQSLIAAAVEQTLIYLEYIQKEQPPTIDPFKEMPKFFGISQGARYSTDFHDTKVYSRLEKMTEQHEPTIV
jgi:Sec-independent protein translocase protein TatA